MGAQLALLVCSVGVLGLFYLDRDKSVQTSRRSLAPGHLDLDRRIEIRIQLVRE